VRPTFEAVAALSLPSSTGAAWAVRQLYIATPTSVDVAFISAPAPDPGALMADSRAAVPPYMQVGGRGRGGAAGGGGQGPSGWPVVCLVRAGAAHL
jgi:hypothetical protein